MRAGLIILRRTIHSCAGVTSIEYAFIASLIAMAIIVAVTILGLSLNDLYSRVADAVK